MKIYLLGFMGSGKSFLGKQLAEKLGFEFIDLDDEVERRNKKTIPEIFENEGELSFRHQEREALVSLQDKDNIVISTGGGAPCFSDNIDIIKRSGTSIYLRMSPADLVNRLKDIKDSRPLIKSKNNNELLQFIEDTLKKREYYYLKADHIIEGENARVEDLISLLNNRDNSFK